MSIRISTRSPIDDRQLLTYLRPEAWRSLTHIQFAGAERWHRRRVLNRAERLSAQISAVSAPLR